MATAKKKLPPAFEKSAKDKDSKAALKKYGKEGSPKEEAFDQTQMGMKKGGGVKKMAKGGRC